MGIDVTALNLLRFTNARHGAFGKTATLGRQSMHVSKAKLQRLLNTPPDYKPSDYCEDLLIRFFGASSVESFDVSDYENATHVVDLNQPWPESLGGFNTVIDCGTLEHVFDVSQAFQNVSNLCVPGGQIMHLLPANNFCGHGFWQFSPELFFSLYSPQNGYQDTQVFLADPNDEETWWEVPASANGRRPGATTKTNLYILCRTKKTGAVPSRPNVQQISIGADADSAPPSALPAFIRNRRLLLRITLRLLRIFPVVKITNMGLNSANPLLIKRDVEELVR